MGTVQVKVIEPHISRQVQCPDCGIWHPFKKAKEHWRTVKAPSLTRPVLLRVRMVYSKCLNPRCPCRIFALPVPGIERYQRATTALIQEGVSGLIEDNTTLQRIANRLSRSLNTSGSLNPRSRGGSTAAPASMRSPRSSTNWGLRRALLGRVHAATRRPV